MRFDDGIMRGQGLEFIGCGDERQLGEFTDFRGHFAVKSFFRVEPGTHRGAALRKLQHPRHYRLDPGNAVGDLLGVTGEFLAQRQRGGVLGVGAANFDNAVPRLGLSRQPALQIFERRQQTPGEFLGAGDVHGGGKRIVRRLGHVAMVVGVDRFFRSHLATHDLDRTVRQDLVDVHVGLGAGTGLPHHQREITVELAGNDVIGGPNDGAADILGQIALIHIHDRAGTFQDGEATNHRLGHLLPADFEVLPAALGLRAPIFVGWHLDGTEGIGLSSGLDLFHDCFTSHNVPLRWRAF